VVGKFQGAYNSTMKIKELLLGALLFFLGQGLAWYQTNGQFISPWIKNNPILVSALFGIPIGVMYIYGTKYVADYSNGELWPVRIVGFVTGILGFTVLTYIHLNEGITLKTGVILTLATVIVLLQVFWRG
jgi:hypothetical protein